MSATLLRAGGLLAVYLLVLTSLAPGDVLIGGTLALAVAFALRPRRSVSGASPSIASGRAFARTVLRTLAEMARGSLRTVRFCLRSSNHAGLVEIPRDQRSRHAVALWGVLTGESPDEVVVDVDEERDVLLVHLVDARNPDAVRERHRLDHEQVLREVVR